MYMFVFLLHLRFIHTYIHTYMCVCVRVCAWVYLCVYTSINLINFDQMI